MILELGADRRAENNLPSTEVCEQRLVKHKHRVLLMILFCDVRRKQESYQ